MLVFIQLNCRYQNYKTLSNNNLTELCNFTRDKVLYMWRILCICCRWSGSKMDAQKI